MPVDGEMIWVQTAVGWARFDVKGQDRRTGKPILVPRDTAKTLYLNADTVWESLRSDPAKG